MREAYWGLGSFALFLSAGLCLFFQAGCGTNQAPTAPASPGPVTLDWAYPVIEDLEGTVSAGLGVRVNGQPFNHAAVSLFGNFPEVPIRAAYAGPVTYSGDVYASYRFKPFTYQAGAVYIMTSEARGATASVTLIAPGNINFVPDDNGAVTLVAAGYSGTAGAVSVVDSTGVTTTFGEDPADFPVLLDPSTAFAGASGTVFDISASVEKDGGTVHGATLSYGPVAMIDAQTQPVTVP